MGDCNALLNPDTDLGGNVTTLGEVLNSAREDLPNRQSAIPNTAGHAQPLPGALLFNPLTKMPSRSAVLLEPRRRRTEGQMSANLVLEYLKVIIKLRPYVWFARAGLLISPELKQLQRLKNMRRGCDIPLRHLRELR